MRSLTNKLLLFAAFILSLILFGCENSIIENPDTAKKKEVRIAVVLEKKDHDYWKRVLNWAKDNISSSSDYIPVYEFYDEDDPNLSTIAYGLANNDSIVSVIGCKKEIPTEILAHQISRLKKDLPNDTLKPMFTFNTSDMVLRKYSTVGSIWGLAESDVTQSEVILSYLATYYQYMGYLNSSVSLLSNTQSYGQSFIDWFAFQSRELGLDVHKILKYDSKEQIPGLLAELAADSCTNVVAIPNSEEEAVIMSQYPHQGWIYYPNRAITLDVYNKAVDKITDPQQKENFMLEGIQLVANPESGFNALYESKYDSKPVSGEAHLYDAVMISSLAKALSDKKGISVNDAVTEILSKGQKVQANWDRVGLKSSFEEIAYGNVPVVSGACGYLLFNPSHTTIIKYSMYALTSIFQNQIIYHDFFSREPYSKRNSSLATVWEWNKKMFEEFDQDQNDIKYPKLDSLRAVVVATSSGWDNYRHQADALDFYRILKSSGYRDKDIILIMEDDLANNKSNPYPGIVQREYNGPNLYKDVVVDYKLSDLTPDDFKNIMLGKSSEKLPAVLKSGAGDNVLLFISGHGIQNVLQWGNDDKTMSGNFMRDMFNQMSELKKYRKLLCVMENCYSGSVAKKCEGIPGILFMTAANEFESSKALFFDNKRNTYLSNSFSSSFIKALEQVENSSIRDFYYETYNMTMGSHVSLYNVENFGNIYLNSMHDFFFVSNFN